MNKPPKVFISHASEDKDRFVRNFALKLRENGIDAWLDEWEIKPGDSLVTKIFEEGIGQADFIIIVLSNVSTTKKWVKEELDISTIKRIENGIKIIPIILDECEVPISLSHLLWIKITDLNSYDKEYGKVRNTILNVDDTPVVGMPPKYISVHSSRVFTDLSKIDNFILDKLSKTFFNEKIMQLERDEMIKLFSEDGITETDLKESLLHLHYEGYLNAQVSITESVFRVRLSSWTISNFINSNYNISLIRNDIIREILNNNMTNSDEIAEKINVHLFVVRKIILDLRDDGCLTAHEMAMGHVFINNIRPKLRRMI